MKKHGEQNTTGEWTAIKRMPVHDIFLIGQILPHQRRHQLLVLVDVLLVLLLLASFALAFFTAPLGFEIPWSVNIDVVSTTLAPKLFAVFLILTWIWLLVYWLELFYRSRYYHNRETSRSSNRPRHMSSEVARFFHQAPDGDILGAFCVSSVGIETFRRLALDKAIIEFLTKRPQKDRTTPEDLFARDVRTRQELAEYLFEKNKHFADFLFSHGIEKEMFLGALSWTTELDLTSKYHERWWSRYRLSKLPRIGRQWSYGEAYQLAEFGTDISAVSANTAIATNEHRSSIKEIEAGLSKPDQANVLLTTIGSGQTLVGKLARRIATGTSTRELEGKRLVRVQTDLLIASVKTKNEFERTFLAVISDAARAGNIILVFYDLAHFLSSAQAFGSDPLHLFKDHLENPELKILATSQQSAYHQNLASSSIIQNRFTLVTASEPGLTDLVQILKEEVANTEARFGVLLTYPALMEIVEAAQHYLPEGVTSEKALDLLSELGPRAQEQGVYTITAEFVKKQVSEKTNIPLGKISPEERGRLEHLEDHLGQKVIGQQSATSALARVLKRSRTGMRDLDKPLGAFLFLGPTGVGKTQTAKAVAEVFFENSEQMARLDMSEYQGPDALERLIGSSRGDDTGTLVKMVKDHSYGVMLLDEFEKADSGVHDLFLQIFDEGFFSDATGKRINAKNLVFIATSNAGSDMIWEASKAGNDVSAQKSTLVRHLIDQQLYKPELLNRFDDVIVFHPLDEDELRQIARLMLDEAAARIQERGYKLVVTESLIDYVAREGYQPAFGARPMERIIKDTVEEVVAEKIIEGSLQKGDRVELTEQDFK